MDLFEAMDYSQEYVPPAIYELTAINRKRGAVNHLHSDMLNCKAYPLFLQDGCWFCNYRNNCNACKANRSYMKEFGEKKQKGRKAGAKRTQTRLEPNNDW